MRIALDEARLTHEREHPREPFHAKDELRIVTPQLLAKVLPMSELKSVFVAAGAALGLDPEPLRSDIAAVRTGVVQKAG